MVILNKKGEKKSRLTEDEKRIAALDLCTARDNYGGKYLYRRNQLSDRIVEVEDPRSVL